MRRIVLASFAAALLSFGTARDASAEEGLGVVRVNVSLQRDREFADVFIERRGTYEFECRAPCSFEAKAGEHGHVDFPGTTDEPAPFIVPNDGTETYHFQIRRRGKAALVGGLVAVAAGALSLALGMAIIRGAGKDDLFGEANGAIGRILLVLGGASAVTGTVLIVTRSTAPVLVPSSSSRREAHEDLTAPRSSIADAAPPLPLQLQWTGRF
jgi:hypothetical protein